MKRSYRRPELTAYRDSEVGAPCTEFASNAECACDCLTNECDLVTAFGFDCRNDSGTCTRCGGAQCG